TMRREAGFRGSAGQGNQGAANIGDDQFRQFFQGLDMGSLPAMGGVEGEADEADAQVPARIDGGGAVRAVGAERIALMGNLIVLRQREKMTGDRYVERAGAVPKSDGDGVVPRRLSGACDAIVDGYKLLNLLTK